MTTTQTLDVIRVLLRHIGDAPEQDRALAMGAIVLLDNMDPKAPAPAQKPKPKKEPNKREKFDVGKLHSLYNGGWSAAMIADDMGVSEATVYNHAKKEGLHFARKTKAKEAIGL